MAGESGARRPEPALSGLAGPPGVTGDGRPVWPGTPRTVRFWRALFSGIWLLYVIQPVGSLFRHGYGVLYISGAIAIVAVFCAYYLYLMTVHDVRRGAPLWSVVPLFALGALACVVYDGAKWNALWIYVSAACGMPIAQRRTAMKAVLAAAACYVLFSWLGHVAVSAFLLTLLPVTLVGLAMIGFRAQVALARELAQARETVARLAASEERLRMARDMHDLTGQSLSLITLKSELAARLLQRLPGTPERDRAREEIEQVAAVSRQTLHDIREAVSGYRRPTLAVEIITARTALEAAGIAPHDAPDLTLLSGTFDPDAEAALAWCLREAVTNVIRHSGARNCHIDLTRRESTLSLAVRDDGHGRAGPDDCDSQPATAGPVPHSSGAGLRGMSERLAAVGGQLQITTATARGFTVIATVPARGGATVAV